MSDRRYALTLGRQTWQLEPGDQNAVPIVARLAQVMRLCSADRDDRSGYEVHRIRIVTQSDGAGPSGASVCVLKEARGPDALFCHLVSLSLFILRDAQPHGCVLLHAALAQHSGRGVILSAPSGVGKTTASNRLPPPWVSLCDDATLVRRDEKGTFWAHPWPTWSMFLNASDVQSASWGVESAVPLNGVYFLKRDRFDHSEPLGALEALGGLNEAARVISQVLERLHPSSSADTNTERVQRFALLCALAKNIPSYQLYLTRNGAFWEFLHTTSDRSLHPFVNDKEAVYVRIDQGTV